MKRQVFSRRNISSSVRLNWARAAALLTAALAVSPAFAVTDTFTGPSGDSWTTAADWTSGPIHLAPVNGDDAVYSAVAILNFNGSYSGAGLNSLTIDAIGHTTSTFRQTTTTTLIAATETIGNTGNTSLYTQTAGSNTVTASLFLGAGANATGNYTLSGAATLAVGSNSAQFSAFEYIGFNGSANFTQSGGTNTVGTPSVLQTLYIGSFAPSTGNYILNNAAATLTVNGNEFVGEGGTGTLSGTTITQYGGTFTQSAGNHTVTGLLTLGDTAAATGSYTLTGGNLTVGTTNPAFTVAEYIGGNGVGAFNQSGGNNTIGTPAAPQTLFLGTISTAIGSYTLSNAASTLLVNGNEIVGNFATGNATQAGGTFTQSQGNHTVTNFLTLAQFAGSTGIFNLSGGNFATAVVATSPFSLAEAIGQNGTGTFNQTGGNHTIGTPSFFQFLEIGQNSSGIGSYNLSGANSKLTVNGQEVVGLGATGTTNAAGVITQYGGSFTQSAGTHLINSDLALAESAGSSASFTLSGGTLTTLGQLDIGFNGVGLFTQTGGAISTGCTSLDGSVLIAALPTSTGTYNISNSASSLNIVQGDIVVGGSSAGPGGVGTFNISAGTITTTVGEFLQIWNNGSSVNFSGGTLNIGSIEALGHPENFHWTGGTLNFLNSITINSAFDLGPNINLNSNMTLTVPSASGTMLNDGDITLSGGTLLARTFTNETLLTGYGTVIGSLSSVNNTGQIIQSGGSLTINSVGFFNSGDIQLASGFILTVTGQGTLTNSGVIHLNGASLTTLNGLTNNPLGVVTGNGTISGNFANAGLLEVDTGLLKVNAAFSSIGTIQLNGTTATLSASITNDATIQGFGRLSGVFTNDGTIEALGGTLTFTSAALTNPNIGILRTTTGTKLLFQGNSFPTNAGLIDLAGGTFDTGNTPLDNTGSIVGFGILATGSLTNDNAITLTGGTSTVSGPVINSAGKSIVVKNNAAIFTGPVTNNGTFVITAATVTFAGGYSGNAYVSDPSTNIFQGPVNIVSGGSMNGGIGDAFIFNTGNFTNSGNFTNAGLLQSSDNTTNSATFTQSGPQSWTPTSSFTNTAGLATFGSNAKLYGLTITGGTVDITTTQMIVEATTNKSAILTALRANIASQALTSSTLPANKTLALSDNAIRLATFPTSSTTFGGNPIDANSLLLTVAYKGDANLDGVVDIQDLTAVANHWQQPVTDWSQGDFNNSNFVDIQDLTAVANNWQAGLTSGGGSSQSFADALAQIGGLTHAAPAPEPASLLLFSLTIPLLSRRRSSL